MNMNPNKSAEQLRTLNRKVIVCPSSGVEVEIRKPTPLDFLKFRSIGIPTQLLDDVKGSKNLTDKTRKVEQAMNRDPERQVEMVRAILGCVISPKVVDDTVEAKDGEVHGYDFGDDLDFVLDEILTFSGLKTPKVGEDSDAEKMMSPFSGEQAKGEAVND